MAIGAYNIAAFCGTAAPVAYTPICQEALLSTTGVDATGSYDFFADGTYANSVNLTLHGILTVPESCMADPPGLTTCDALQTRLLQRFSTASCSGTSGCTCTVTSAATDSQIGNCSVQGQTLTFTRSSGSPVSDPYCVSGSQITIELRSIGGSSAQGTVVLLPQ